MARIPTAETLGVAPIQSNRPPASIDRAEARQFGAGAEALGEVGKAFGEAAHELKKKTDEAETYEVNKRLLEFGRDQTRQLDEQRRTMAPGGAGFADQWRSGYDSAARDVFAQARRDGLSAHALDRLDLGLVSTSEQLQTRALTHQLDEQNRYHMEDLGNSLAGVIGDVRANPTPDMLRQRREQGERLIDSAPIDQRFRPGVRQRFLRNLEEEARFALLQGIQTSQDADRANEAVIGHVVPGNRATRDRAGTVGQPPGTSGTPGALGVPAPSVPAAATPRSDGTIGALGSPGEPPSGGPPASPSNLPVEVAPVPGNRTPVGTGPRSGTIEGIVLHHTSGTTLDSALSQNRISRTGYNYYIDRDGTAYQFVPDEQRINHVMPAGSRDRRPGVSPNLSSDNTLGIGVVARSDADITPAQQATLARLTGQLAAQYQINSANIVGHGELQTTREETEGSFARAYREGRVAAAAGNAGTAAGPAAGPSAAGQPSPVQPAAAPGAIPGQDVRRGSGAWALAQLDAEARGEGTRQTEFTHTTAAQARGFANQVNARVAQLRNAIQQQMQGWEEDARKGILPPAALVAQTREQVESFGDPQLTENFEYLVGSPPSERFPQGRPGLAQYMRSFMTLHPERMDQVVNAEDQRQQVQGATHLDLQRLEAMRTLQTRAREQINTNADGWAQRARVVLPDGRPVQFGQVNFRDDGSMRARADMARAVGTYYGQAPQFFTPAERDAARDVLRLGGQPSLDMLASMVRNWGADSVYQLNERGPDGHVRDPELAAVGALVVNARSNNGAGMQAAQDLADEIRLRHDDPNYHKNQERFKPKETDLRPAQEFIGRTYEANPAVGSAAIAATDLLYARWARTNAVTTFNDRQYRTFFMQVIGQSNGQPGTSTANNTYGGIYYQNGRSGNPIPVPSNIRNDPVSFWGTSGVQGIPLIMEVLRPEDLRTVQSDVGGSLGPVGASGRELTMRDLRNGRLVSIGGGRYVIDTANNPAAPAWAMAPPGAPTPSDQDRRFILDLNALQPALRDRIPEIYRDYQFGEAGRFRPIGFGGPLTPTAGGRPGMGGPTSVLGPEHPDYPRGQFAPQVNPGRAITQPEWVEFNRQFRERHPSERERAAITSSQSRYWKELQQFIDKLPPAAAATPPALPAGSAEAPSAASPLP